MSTPTYYDIIQLHADEWGNEIMRTVAMEHFERNPELQFVHVREHAGWHLGFRRDESCWGSANDGAVIRGPFPDTLRNVINRNNP